MLKFQLHFILALPTYRKTMKIRKKSFYNIFINTIELMIVLILFLTK